MRRSSFRLCMSYLRRKWPKRVNHIERRFNCNRIVAYVFAFQWSKNSLQCFQLVFVASCYCNCPVLRMMMMMMKADVKLWRLKADSSGDKQQPALRISILSAQVKCECLLSHCRSASTRLPRRVYNELEERKEQWGGLINHSPHKQGKETLQKGSVVSYFLNFSFTFSS